LEVGGAALRALRLEARRNDAEEGRNGDAERRAEDSEKTLEVGGKGKIIMNF